MADSTNTKRLEVRRHELHGLLDEDELKDAKLCVFAHAQDMDRALSKAEIASALHLPALKNRQWTIFRTAAIKGEGITAGLE